jgi:endo-1,4-beta-mannosidase
MKLHKTLAALFCTLMMPIAIAGPLTVTNGKFTKDGAPFNGVGVNYFNAFTRYALNGNDMSWKTGLGTLNYYQIPFIRINTFGFWSTDIQNQYLNNKTQFYERLDKFMDEAAAQNVGVIMSLFFNFTALPELNKEDYAAWGDGNSTTRKMMRAMTAEIVTRYKGHAALWGWEFNNEKNQFMDLPDSVNNFRWLPPRADKAPRTRADNYSVQTILPAMAEFADIIRSLDSATPIFSGNNSSRFDSYHLYKLNSWDADTPEQYGLIVSRDNAGKVNTLTIHLYPETEGTLFGNQPSTISDILAAVMARSAIDGRPFFLGEFGTNDATLGNEGAKQKFIQITDAILQHRVPLSAAWAFDLFQQTGTYNITSSNSRSYQLDTLKEMNKKMKNWK